MLSNCVDQFDVVSINDLSVEAIIGVYAYEQECRQPLLLDIEIYTDISGVAHSDHIDDAIDYAKIAESISQFCYQSGYQLIEALAEGIAKLILSQNKVFGVKVKLRKPQALAKAHPGAHAGICISRFNR